MQTNKESESGFNTILINLDNFLCVFKTHVFKNDLFIVETEKPFTINGTTKQILYQSEDFLREIKKIPIPLKHKDKLELELFDLFVFPDLEPILNDEEKISQYHNSEQVLFENGNEKILIEGASQSGKTSLLNRYFVDLYNLGYFPVYLHGKNIKSEDAESFLKKAIKEQYAKVDNQWDKFSQIKIEKRYILIDNFDQCPLNEKAKNTFLKKIERYFEKIVVMVSEENEIHAISENEKIYDNYKNYKILPLGRVKRNEIIEKWLLLRKDISNLNDEELSHVIKSSFDSVNDLLGEQLIPSYPIFILTLLQSLENAIQPFNIAPTSYAYCYQSLIHVGLTKAGVDQKDIGSLFNFLSELSYELYSNKNKKITEDEIELFYTKYIKDFIIKYNVNELLEILLKSTILIKEDNYYYFSYKYISFYLTAKYISRDIGDEKTQREISKLCANLESEDSANILIFLTHHTHQNFLLDEILITSMMPFEMIQPITLEVSDPFFKFLNEFIKEVKTEVIPAVSNHKANRIKNLEKQDKRDHKLNKFKNKKDNVEDLPEEMKEFIRVFKIIKILGQITKNQQGNFKKEKLLELLKAAYIVCFRSINFVSEIIQNEKDNIIQKILEDKDQDQEHLKNKISQILFNLGYKVCLQSFSNLCIAVGASNMDEIYDEVAKDIKTPAAKLITFSIKSYYGKLNVSELEFLIEEFKTNPVTTDILRARVKSYLYQHKVDYKKEQKISSICNFKIDQSKKLIEKIKNK